MQKENEDMRRAETLKQRIKKHFLNKDYDYCFEWGKDKQKWGAKYETIFSLSRLFDCPYTSLYIPVKQLSSEGFLTYQDRLISKEEPIKTH